MANLYGGVQGSRGQATRLGSQSIRVFAQTYNTFVRVTLYKGGGGTVTVSDKSGKVLHGITIEPEGDRDHA